MRIVFMGTAELACPCLEAVANLDDHAVVGVITQPDRPKGRNLHPAPPPVKVTATARHVPVSQPANIRAPEAVATLQTWRPDLIIVVAYGQLLPVAVLEIPPLGCINVHTSLLPRWRGAAPIQYAILHGDRQTGVTTMYLNEQMDAGDIILQRPEPIQPDDTSATLHDRLAAAGAELLVETVRRIARGDAPRIRQDETRITVARKLTKDAGRIDWHQQSETIERQVRAFTPWPSAFTHCGDTPIKIWRAVVQSAATGLPGEVLEHGVVATGAGGLQLLEVQPASGKRMSFEAFSRGHRVVPGMRLD